MTDEITFSQAVSIRLIRIVRAGRNVHQNVRKLVTITQSDKPIKNLEIFGRNFSAVSSRYSLIYSTQPSGTAERVKQIQADNADILIPLEPPVSGMGGVIYCLLVRDE